MAFKELQSILVSEPVMAYPRKDRPYSLITDALLGDCVKSGGSRAILSQENQGRFRAIAYASWKLQDHEKNYTPYLRVMDAAVWAMKHIETDLLGKHFILFTDHKPLETLEKVHTRTFNRLQLA